MNGADADGRETSAESGAESISDPDKTTAASPVPPEQTLPAGVVPPSAGKDPYGPQLGCMISLGVLILVAPALLYINAPLFMLAAVTGALAWLLNVITPAAWKNRIGAVRLFILGWAVLLLATIGAFLYVKYTLDSAAGDFIRRM
ncbi:MAG: hypothetical protein KA004_02185 [Verrucomicrobiales bacterium]|nr:hypothetical protein [Verrucomicrobiales bacterium]